MKITHKIIMCMLLATGLEMHAVVPHVDAPVARSQNSNTGPKNSTAFEATQKTPPAAPRTPAPIDHPEGYNPADLKTVHETHVFDFGNARLDSSFTKDPNATGFDAFSDKTTTIDPTTGNKTVTSTDPVTGNITETITDLIGNKTEIITDPTTGDTITTITDSITGNKIIKTIDSKNNTTIKVVNSKGDILNNNKTNTSQNARSTLQALSNKTNNALSISGNQKTTITDPATENTTVTTTAKDGTFLASKTTNSKGQLVQTVMVNPVSKATKTVIYNNPSDKTDKSSTTIIDQPSDPNSPITETRNKTGRLTSIKNKKLQEIGEKDKSGNLVATKTTMTALDKLFDANNKLINVNATPDQMFSEDIKTAQFQATQKFQAAMEGSNKLTNNQENLSVKAFGAPQDDANAAYRATRDFEKATRTTVHSGYNELTSTIASAQRLGQKVDPKVFVRKLIQQSINNRFPPDIKSGQNRLVLSNDQHDFITQKLLTELEKDPKFMALFDPTNKIYKNITEVDKLNIMAQIVDAPINFIGEGIAKVTTIFKTDGTCTSTTESTNLYGTKIKLSSSFDFYGNPTEKSIAIDDTIYTTTVGSGWFGKTTTTVTGSAKPLTSKDGAFLSQAWILNKSITSFKLATKIALSAPKQIVINGVGVVIPMAVQGFILAAYIPAVKIASMIPAIHVTDVQGKPMPVLDKNGNIVPQKDKYGNTIKDAQGNPVPKLQVKTFTGYQFTGYDINEPTVRLATFKLVDLSGIGDDGTSLPSQGLHYVMGTEGALMPTGKGSPVFNPNNPIARAFAEFQGKTPEQAAQEAADLNVRYATIVDPVVSAIQIPFKFLFPRTIGDQILSKSDISKSDIKASLSLFDVLTMLKHA